MPNEETKKEVNTVSTAEKPEVELEEAAPEETDKGTWREAFVAAFQKTTRQQKPMESRRELGRDKSKSLLLLLGVCVGLLLLFFGLFPHPKNKIPLPGEKPHSQPNLGQRVTPGQENRDPTKAVTPMLSADVRPTDPGAEDQLTPEDIGRTSRTAMAPKPAAT